MKKLVLLVSAFLLSSSAFSQTNYVDQSLYIDLEKFFSNFYEENFTNSGENRLSDNGYLASALAWFDKPEDMSHLLVNKLISKRDIKQAIIESMLTTFAYARPNQKEKRIFAQIIYRELADKFDIYWIQTNSDIRAKTLISLTSSCGVGGPEKMLVMAQKESESHQPAVYLVRSDVCD